MNNESYWISLAVSVVSFCASALALFLSYYRVQMADEANFVASSNAWVSVILKHIEEEIKTTQQEADLFLSFFNVPFQDLSKKKEALRQLGALREESSRRQYILKALVPASATLIAQRAALEKIDHEFMYNDELALVEKDVTPVVEMYGVFMLNYFDVIRQLGVSVSVHRSSTLGVSTSFMRANNKILEYMKNLTSPD